MVSGVPLGWRGPWMIQKIQDWTENLEQGWINAQVYLGAPHMQGPRIGQTVSNYIHLLQREKRP